MLVDHILSCHRPLFGEVLVAVGRISYTQLDEALRAQQKHSGYLGDLLVESGRITASDIAATLRVQEEFERRRGPITATNRVLALAEVIAVISSGEPLDRVLQEIVQQVRSAMGFDRAGIFLVNLDANRIEGTWGTNRKGKLRSISSLRYPLGTARGLASLYAAGEPYFYIGHGRIKHRAFVPMRLKGDTIGFIVVDNLLTQRPFGPEVISPLQDFAAGAVVAVAQARLTQALRRSQEDYKTLIDNVNGVVFECDVRTWQFTFVSKQVERLLGYPVERWLGDPAFFISCIHPDDRDWVVATCEEETRSKRNYQMVYRMVAADGRVLWVKDNATVIVENDEPVKLCGIIIDITERKRAEEALRDSEERYRRLVEQSPEVIAVHSNGRFVYLNPAGTKLFGAARSEEILNRPILEVVHPDFRAIVKERVQQSYEQDLATPLLEQKLVGLDGRVIDAEVIGMPIRYQGAPATQIVIRDITERKRAEQALRASEERLQFLLSTSPAVIYSCRADGDYPTLFISDNVTQLLGYTPQQFLADPRFLLQRTHPDDLAQYQIELAQVFELDHHAIQYRLLHHDGSYRWIHDEIKLVRDAEGRPTEMVGYCVDVTERKRNETRERGLLHIGTLVASQIGVDEVLRSIVEQVRSTLEFDRVGVLVVDEDRDEIASAFGTSDQGETLDERGRRVCWSTSHYHQHIAGKQGLLYTPDAHTDFGLRSRNGDPVRHHAVVPCRARGQVTGLISVDNALTHRPFGMVEVNQLRIFADLAGLAIDNARLLERSQRSRARAETLARISQRLATTLELQPLLRAMWDEVHSLLRPDFFLVQVFERGNYRAALLIDEGVEYPSCDIDMENPEMGFRAWVHRERRTLVIHDTEAEADRMAALGIVRGTPIGTGKLSRSAIVVPFLSGDEYLGCLGLQSYQPNAFTTDDVQLLEGIAGCALAGIKNASLHQQAQRRTEQLEALNQITRAMASEVNLEGRLERLYEETVAIIPADTFVISMARPQANEFAVLLLVDEGVRYSGIILKADPGTPAQHILDTRESLLIADMHGELERGRWRHTAVGGAKISRSWLVSPMIYGDAVTGFVGCYSYEPNLFTTEHQALLAAVANRAALGLRNARLYERTQSQLKELSALYEIASSVAHGASPQELAHQITEVLPSIIPSDGVGIVLQDPDTQTWQLVSHAGIQSPGFELGVPVPLGGVVGRVLRTGEPVRIGDVAQEPAYLVAHPSTRSGLCVPLKVGNRVIGAIDFEAQQPDQFRRHHEQLAMTAASNIAALIDNSRLIAELKRANEELTTMQDQLVQAEKLRALGEVASGVAHDFNNRLSGVLGFTELLQRRDGLDEQARDYLDKIRLSAEDAAATVRRMQNFARQDPDHGLAALDVNSLVHDIVGLTRHKWHDTAFARGLAIQVNCNLNATVLARGNAPELREVLTNLIYNAVDAMPTGGVITVETSVEDDGEEDQRRVLITVTDTGTGMTEDVKSRIFDPFFTTKGVSGTGLGLSVCYGIIQRHQGSITADSAPGSGTTFTIRLPAGTASALKRTPARRSGNFAPWRILCVEDDYVVRTLVVDLLNALGHRAVAAATGAEAVARFERESFDLVITDQGMPGMTGEVVAKHIKERSARTPVILLSGWAAEYMVTRPVLPNIDALVAKPVQMQELANVIQEVMNAATAPA